MTFLQWVDRLKSRSIGHYRQRRALERFAANRLAVLGLACLFLLSLFALIGPWLITADPLAQDVSAALQTPSMERPCGTDQLGRDVCARLAYGARASLLAGLLAVVAGGVSGAILGLIAGYLGGTIDRVIMRVMDGLFAMPAILLAIVVVAWLGPNLTNAVLAIALVRVPGTARIMRASVLAVVPSEYVVSARLTGGSDWHIIRRHVIPNSLAPLIVETTIGFAFAILSVAALGFLGLGAQPPNPEWGAMISEARNYMYSAFYITLFPGIAIFVATVSANLIGDGLQDASNPKLSR